MLEDGNKCRIGELIKWISNWRYVTEYEYV